MHRSAGSLRDKSPHDITAMGVFLVFGAAMATLAGATLVWPGTSLDRIWTLNNLTHRRLAPYGRSIGIPFLLLGVTLTIAAVGWFRGRLWAWRLAVAIIALQVLGDIINSIMGDAIRGVIGFGIASALLFYLLRADVKSAFAPGGHA
jgi:hypothetical protein